MFVSNEITKEMALFIISIELTIHSRMKYLHTLHEPNSFVQASTNTVIFVSFIACILDASSSICSMLYINVANEA